MRHCFDPKFIYYRFCDTDLKRTFARIRYEQEKAKEATAKVVKPLIRGKTNGR